MKVKNRLLDFNMVIYQDDDWFKFSLDSVLLSNFVTINLRSKNIIDLCCGNAPIPMLLSNRTNVHIDGIEIQKCIYDLGIESIKDNKLDKQINLICGDIKEIDKYFESDFYDTVICNPPYFKTNNNKYYNHNSVKAIARHELKLTLEDIVKAARYLLKNGGNFAMVHRSDRFIEIIELFRKYNLEPKRIQFIYPKKGCNSDLFMIEATKNGNVGMKILPELIVHNEDGSYTDYVRSMYS